MKQFFTLFVALCAFVCVGKAQVLYSENFDGEDFDIFAAIDLDGDDNYWGIMEDEDYAHSGSQCAVSASYDDEAYEGLTPDNWLVLPELELNGNYNLSFWIAHFDEYTEYYSVYLMTEEDFYAVYMGDASAIDNMTVLASGYTTEEWQRVVVDLSAYNGQSVYIAFRHHNSEDNYYLFLDDILVEARPTEATIQTSAAELELVTAVGRPVEDYIEVESFNLTEDITVATAAPFAVSADGETYAASITIPAEGGSFFVQYLPTVAGTVTGTITLTSTGASAEIALTGNAVECATITEFPYTYNFDDEEEALCWSVVDNNNDGATWGIDAEAELAFYEWSEENDADDYLVSPTFAFTGNEVMTLHYACLEPMELEMKYVFTEYFTVFAYANGEYTPLCEQVTANSADFQELAVDLASLVGEYQIAIHAESEADSYYLLIADFNVLQGDGIREQKANAVRIYPNPATSTLNVEANGANKVEILNVLGQVVYSSTMTDNAQINVSNLNNGVYFVRLNGTATQKFIKK